MIEHLNATKSGSLIRFDPVQWLDTAKGRWESQTQGNSGRMHEQAEQTFSVAGVHGVQQKGPPLAGLQVFPQDGLEGIIAVGAGAASHCPIERDACRGKTRLSPGYMQAKMHPHARLRVNSLCRALASSAPYKTQYAQSMMQSGSTLRRPHYATPSNVVYPLFTAHALEVFVCSIRAVPASLELVSGVVWTIVCCI